MKGFRSTGNGPRKGFSFPSKGGFGPSSGRVKNVAGYTRRAPKRLAVGGLLKDNIVDTPGGPADFAKGGSVKSSGPTKRLGYRNTRADVSVHDGKGNYEVASLPRKVSPKSPKTGK